MAEIGSYRGESAELFLSTGKVSHIYCIDPWKPFYDKSDPAAYTDMAKVERTFDSRFADDNRVTKIKGTIDDFVDMMSRRNAGMHIDFVYIDGCHTREATEHDISVVMEHIKPGLAIAGHDYVGFSGVKIAVDSRFGKPDKIFSDTSWRKVL